jgi:ethanolaminephosphotransferase
VKLPLCCAGCDALSVHLAVTCIGTSIGVGFTKWTVLGVMSIMGPWLLAHWEEYHSGIMLYGNGYWGVTEANYLMVLLHFFTAAVDPGKTSLCERFPSYQH